MSPSSHTEEQNDPYIPDPDLLRKAQCLMTKAGACSGKYPRWQLYPIEGNAFQFEWEFGTRHLEMEFFKEGHICVLAENSAWKGEDGYPAMEAWNISMEEVDEVKEALEWLIGNSNRVWIEEKT